MSTIGQITLHSKFFKYNAFDGRSSGMQSAVVKKTEEFIELNARRL